MKLIAPADGSVVRVLTPKMYDFLEFRRTSDDGVTPVKWEEYYEGDSPCEHSRPLDTLFSWTDTGAKSYTLTLSGDGVPTRTLTSEKNSLPVRNLYIGTTYRWHVTDGKTSSEEFTFSVPYDAPRPICIPSASNVRDLGGWRTRDGRHVRQGCMYRSAEYSDHYNVTPQGKAALAELGIKIDLDIRGKADDEPLAGTGIRKENFALGAYEGAFNTYTPETVRRLYDLMYHSPEEPFVLHCWGGADRTGTVVYMMNGLLGVCDADLCTDYEFTCFSNHGARAVYTEVWIDFKKKLRTYGTEDDDENTLVEKFFLSSGITHAQIEALRQKLLV